MGKELPLEGIRIIDVTSIWAGPWATQILAYLGAQVIKVESLQRMDPWRGPAVPGGPKLRYPKGEYGDDPYNRDAFYNTINRNKMSLTVDLSKVEGKDVFRKLIPLCDVLVDNFRSGQMEKFGFGWTEVSKIKPEMIMISMPGFGNSGPYKDFISWGPVLEAVSGMTNFTRYGDGQPTLSGSALVDAIAGGASAAAVITALIERKRTGRGKYIDMSQLEVATTFLGPSIIDAQFSDTENYGKGNDHEAFAPYGSFRCKGEDEWVAIAVETDADWKRFCSAIGNPVLYDDSRFKNSLDRWKNRRELNSVVEHWTSERDKYQIMELLQKNKVCAGVLLKAGELMDDPHFVQGGFFGELQHPSAGTQKYPGIPFKYSEDGYCAAWKPAPRLGEHNRYVLQDLLGIPDNEVDELSAKSIIGTKPFIQKSF